MGATFSRIKNWTTEVLSNTDLNAEIDNILDNLGPAGVDDYSTTTTQMRITTDPGEVGSESLATSLAGELERLRFAIKEIKGSDATQWYSSPGITLTDILNTLGGSVGDNRLVSGAASSNSGAPRFLVASGTTTSVTLDAAPTNFVYYINGTSYTATADVTFTGLSTAATTNHTVLVNDVGLTGQERSKWVGEDGTDIIVDAMGSEIVALTDKYAGFKVVSGGSTEYFIGYVKSSTRISNCLRGYFFNSSSAAMPRIPISDNNTITLTKLTWMFANTSAGLAASYVNPSVSYATPSDTAVYWLDLANNVWKKHDGSNWVTAAATLIGACLQDETACKGARGFDFFGNYDPYTSLQLDYVTATKVQSRNFGGKIGVGSSLINFGNTKPVWDITVNLESGYTESASTTYFAYVGDSGQIRLSPEKPYNASGLGRGWYHPYETWRAVGNIENDGSSNFVSSSLKHYMSDVNVKSDYVDTRELKNVGLSAEASGGALTLTMLAADGKPLSPGNPAFISFRNNNATSGITLNRMIADALSITIPSGATLGHGTAPESYVFIYAADNSGTVSLAVASTPVEEFANNNITAISATSHAGRILYGSNMTGKSIRYLGKCYYAAGGNGTWAAPTRLHVGDSNQSDPDLQVQEFSGHQIAASTSIWHSFTAAATLSPGDWKLNGAVQWNGTSNLVASFTYGFFGARGNDTGSVPAAITTLPGISIVAGFEGSAGRWLGEDNDLTVGILHAKYFVANIPQLIVRVTTMATVYVAASSTAYGTGVNLMGQIQAERIQGPT